MRMNLHPGRSEWAVARVQIMLAVLLAALVAAMCVVGCIPTPVPTPTPTHTETPTLTATPSPTPTMTPTAVPLAEWLAQARAAALRSDLAEAEDLYRRVLDADPAYVDAYLGMVELYRWQPGRQGEMLVAAQQAVSLAPERAESHAALALAHLYHLNDQDAGKAIQRAVELDDQAVAVQLALAEVALLKSHWDETRWDEARHAVESAAQQVPRSALVCYTLGRVYQYTAEFRYAEAAFLRALDLEPDFAPWHVALAELYALLGREDQVDLHIARALELLPEYVPALAVRAQQQIVQEAYQEAGALVRTIVTLAPTDVRGYLLRGDLSSSRYGSEYALGDYHKALELAPLDWRPNLRMGNAYLNSGNCDLAERQFIDALAMRPRLTEGHLGLGRIDLDCKNDIETALMHLRRATERNPYHAEAWETLAMAYLANEDLDQALAAYVRALDVSPNPAQVHTQLGDLYLTLQDINRARAEFRAALRLDPDLHDARCGLARVYLALEEPALAIAMAEEILVANPDHIDARILRGTALLEEGNAEEAAKVLRAVTLKGVGDPAAYLHLARAYRDLGDYARAKTAIHAYLSLDPECMSGAVYCLMVKTFAAALGENYRLVEAEALEEMEGVFRSGTKIPYPFDITVVDVEGQRVLDLAVVLEAESDEAGAWLHLITGLAVEAIYGPRIEPDIDGGVQARAGLADGTVLHTIRLERDGMLRLGDGQLFGDDILRYLIYPQGEARSRQLNDGLDKEIETMVAELRELDFDAPVAYRFDLDEYMASDEETDDFDLDQLLLLALGVLTPEDDLSARWQGLPQTPMTSTYDLERHILHVRDGPLSVPDQVRLIYEYAYALLDQRFELDELNEGDLSLDQWLARWTLAEGDAALTMLLYTEEHMPVADRLALWGSDDKQVDETRDELDEYLLSWNGFAYHYGGAFVREMYDDGGWEAVNEAYTAPPRSTEQILHPERYLQGDEPHEIVLPDLVDGMGEDWEMVDEDVLGELRLRLVLARHIGPAAAAVGAEGWGGDRYVLLYQPEQDAYALVLRIAWDDQAQAEEFWSIYGAYLAHRTDLVLQVRGLVRDPSRVWWTGANEPEALFATQRENQTTIVVASDEADVSRLVSLLGLGGGKLARAGW